MPPESLWELVGYETPPTAEELREILRCYDCDYKRYDIAMGRVDDVSEPCECGRDGCVAFLCRGCGAVMGGFGPAGCPL